MQFDKFIHLCCHNLFLPPKFGMKKVFKGQISNEKKITKPAFRSLGLRQSESLHGDPFFTWSDVKPTLEISAS